MTSPDPLDQPSDSSSARLRDAAEALRGRSRQHAVEIADKVLLTALRSTRRSLPVRVAAPHDYVRVSDQVVITLLRHEIDAGLSGAAVGRIHLLVDRTETLRELTIELLVQYGEVLVEVADQARAIADTVLAGLLTGPEVTVDVVTSHVHVSDVTVGDPHLVDPADERGNSLS